jgi:hypothetical protein
VVEVPVPRPPKLDLTVPDDRLVASTLLLQSAHPGSAVFVARAEPIDRKGSLTAPKPALATAMSLSDAAAFSPSRDANLALAHNVCGASVTIAWCEREIAAAGDRTGGLRVTITRTEAAPGPGCRTRRRIEDLAPVQDAQ